MWFPSRFRELGSPKRKQFLALKEAVKKLDERDWAKGNSLKNMLAGDRPTQSIFIFNYNLDVDRPDIFPEQGYLSQDDIDFYDSYDLADLITPLVKYSLGKLREDCIVARMQLARMGPGARINRHYDNNGLLIASHRMHVPIITHDKLQFLVGGERVVMKEGFLYELNNQLMHSVLNPPDAPTRVHLIFDLLPKHFNNRGLMSRRLEFDVRKYQAGEIKAKAARHIELPKVLVTSVACGAHQSPGHEGVYLVDMQGDVIEQVFDWCDEKVRFQGRPLDRGPRGIAIFQDRVFIATDSSIYEFDKSFGVVNKFENQFLGGVQEISISDDYLYATSKKFDSLLRLDLSKGDFDKGWSFFEANNSINFRLFDPLKADENSPSAISRYQLDSVSAKKNFIYLSGLKMDNVCRIIDDELEVLDRVPREARNAQPFGKGIIYNDTEVGRVVYSNNYDYRCFDIPKIKAKDSDSIESSADRLLDQSVSQGLCPLNNGVVIFSSSQPSIMAYDFKNRQLIKNLNMSSDACNVINGLEVWPF
jgi:hypothetical protein